MVPEVVGETVPLTSQEPVFIVKSHYCTFVLCFEIGIRPTTNFRYITIDSKVSNSKKTSLKFQKIISEHEVEF